MMLMFYITYSWGYEHSLPSWLALALRLMEQAGLKEPRQGLSPLGLPGGESTNLPRPGLSPPP